MMADRYGLADLWHDFTYFFTVSTWRLRLMPWFDIWWDAFEAAIHIVLLKGTAIRPRATASRLIGYK